MAGWLRTIVSRRRVASAEASGTGGISPSLSGRPCHFQDDLAGGGTALEQTQGLRAPGERQAVGNVRPQATLLEPAPEFLKLCLHPFRRMLAVGAPVEAKGCHVLDQQDVCRDLLHFATGKTDHHRAATPGGAAEGACEDRAAERIEDDVG